MAAVLTLTALALLGLSAATAAQAARSGVPAGSVYRNLRQIVVRPGDTLWGIATQAQPGGDPRIVIQQIVDLNALPGTAIQPGERLWVPRS